MGHEETAMTSEQAANEPFSEREGVETRISAHVELVLNPPRSSLSLSPSVQHDPHREECRDA
jgi:hypothetical protein